MKLLSWLRGKEQNGLVSSEGFKGDLCCLKAQVSSEVQDIRTNSFSFSFTRSCLEPNPSRVEEENLFHEDGFCGFLTIGTLGTEPETPKFAAAVIEDNVTGDNKEMAKLITEKLDKFIEEEYHEKTSNKRVESSNEEKENDKESIVCDPLQGYDLYPSQLELTKRSNGETKMKKGLLTSLLKRRQNVRDCSMETKLGRRYSIKRIFEKFNRSLTKTRFDDDDDEYDDHMPKKKELKKSVQIFKRKVHPVLSSPSRDDNKKDERRSCINRPDLKVPSLSESNRKGENWIKTDAEYLVLEL